MVLPIKYSYLLICVFLEVLINVASLQSTFIMSLNPNNLKGLQN